MSVQRCAGCGIESLAHPIVGIGQPTDELKPYQLPSPPNARGFVAYGVCKACHVDPSKRVRQLKMAFFDAAQLSSALAEAGSNAVRM